MLRPSHRRCNRRIFAAAVGSTLQPPDQRHNYCSTPHRRLFFLTAELTLQTLDQRRSRQIHDAAAGSMLSASDLYCNYRIYATACTRMHLCSSTHNSRDSFPAALEAYILMRMNGMMVFSKSYYDLLKSLINSENGLIVELILCDFIKACGIFEPRMVNIICLYLCKKNVEEAIRFFSYMSKRNISLGVLTVVVNTLKDRGRVQDALKFLFEAEEDGIAADVVVYSIIVDGLCKQGCLEKALDLCTTMRKKGIIPNISTYNSVIHGLCHQGCLVEAFRIFDSLEGNGLSPTTVTYAILICALSGEGFLQDAKQLLERMAVKGISYNTRIYNFLINGYCSFGFLEEGIKLFMDLLGSSLEPDSFTISSLIYGYSIKGDMQGALTFYNVYREKGHSPDFLGFLNLIKGLYTKGRMEEARTIIRDMFRNRQAADLVNKAGDGLNFDSFTTCIELACEEGRLHEVINILTEVSFKFFSPWWSKNCDSIDGIKDVGNQYVISTLSAENERKVYESGDIDLIMSAVPRNTLLLIEDGVADRKEGLSKAKFTNLPMNEYQFLCQESLYYDFETYYSIVASLCSKGELQKANSIVKATVLSSGKKY